MNHNETRLGQLENVVEATQDRLFRFAFHRVGSAGDAQDIVQDVLVKLFAGTHDLSSVDNVVGYLFRSVANACNDHLRRRRFAAVELTDRITDRDGDAPVDEAALMAEYERVRKLMEGLPDEQAGVIMMRTAGGMSFVGISSALGIPVTTVKSRFKYGIEKLRAKIKSTDREE